MTTQKSPDALAMELAMRAAYEIYDNWTDDRLRPPVSREMAETILAKTKLAQLCACAEALREILPYAFGLSQQIGATPGNHDAVRMAEQALAALNGNEREPPA